MTRLRGLCIGAGYFSSFHLDAWRHIPEVEIVAICDIDPIRSQEQAARFGIAQVYQDARQAFEKLELDFVDIITRSEAHLPLVQLAAARGVAIICQKPLAPDITSAEAIVATAKNSGVPLMVHENFRFQPWHRELKKLIENGTIGALHALSLRWRPGDGWGADAYQNRQPYFREMPRFLIVETGIHIVDTFRFLAGEVAETYAILRKLNPLIAGEDAGLVTFRFENGAVGIWDANRFNEGTAANPWLTFGELTLEGDGGTLHLCDNGQIFIRPLGGSRREHEYEWRRQGFAGDSVYAVQRHFVDQLKTGGLFETSGDRYLRNLVVQESIYLSAAQNQPVRVEKIGH